MRQTRAVPVTATVLAACLVAAFASPQAAMAATPVLEAAVPLAHAPGYPEARVLAVRVPQQYRATGPEPVPSPRDGFSVGGSAAPSPSGTTTGLRTGQRVVRPVAGDVPTAGGFGSRWVRGCGACSTNHQGLDFAARWGSPVVASMDGRVAAAGVLGGYGNQVLLQHPDGSRTRYGHLSRIDVRAGQTVAVGQVLGAVGNTGVSTGAHLHFEVIVSGVPRDPAVWLRARGLL
ncbi:M23 family metallopeptidase [Curtobacterium sp. ISL-83]|uniref:M23 family metallopeptidase n=1 Tax=Curtobacterium sp. ISL-83 TaxID=2819145 RepID=UPI001BEB7BD6|nr:M23 family metallopeptidase [Curtobacterium sp. ISL-83]MBT2502800.1 M23 family metallopeptidase [Curtobacterium sp. ISL-83]